MYIFALNFVCIFFPIFFAKENIVFGILSEEDKCFFGIINECPFEMGFISKIAIASLFSSILKLCASPKIIEQKIHLGIFFGCSGVFGFSSSVINLFWIANCSNCSSSIPRI